MQFNFNLEHFLTPESLLYASTSALLLSLIVLIWVLVLHIKLRNMLVGKNLKNLEETFIKIQNELRTLGSFKQKTDLSLKHMDARIKKSVQGVETIRFNPFKGTGSGGNQSFSTAILSENGDGVIFSSLYSRDRISVFSKPVKNFTAEFELTDEEKSALEKAKQKIPTPLPIKTS